MRFSVVFFFMNYGVRLFLVRSNSLTGTSVLVLSVTCSGVSFEFIPVIIAEWPPFSKELLARLAARCLYAMCVCDFIYLPFWFRGQNYGSDWFSSWSLLTFYLFFN